MVLLLSGHTGWTLFQVVEFGVFRPDYVVIWLVRQVGDRLGPAGSGRPTVV